MGNVQTTVARISGDVGRFGAWLDQTTPAATTTAMAPERDVVEEVGNVSPELEEIFDDDGVTAANDFVLLAHRRAPPPPPPEDEEKKPNTAAALTMSSHDCGGCGQPVHTLALFVAVDDDSDGCAPLPPYQLELCGATRMLLLSRVASLSARDALQHRLAQRWPLASTSAALSSTADPFVWHADEGMALTRRAFVYATLQALRHLEDSDAMAAAAAAGRVSCDTLADSAPTFVAIVERVVVGKQRQPQRKHTTATTTSFELTTLPSCMLPWSGAAATAFLVCSPRPEDAPRIFSAGNLGSCGGAGGADKWRRRRAFVDAMLSCMPAESTM